MSIKEALDELLEDLMRLAASYEMAGHDESRRLDAEVAAAKAVVLALYEKQKAIADELAEALSALVPLANCGWDGDCCPGAECKDDPDCAAIIGKVRAALAAYNKAKEG